jgi:hypothetical protein
MDDNKCKLCLQCNVEKLVSEFNKNRSKPDGLQTFCRSCAHINFKRYYDLNTDKQKSSCSKRRAKYVLLTQQYVYDYLSTHQCVDCDETDPIVLEFDHVKDIKKNNISVLVHNGSSLKVIMKEIEKCEVRCANCHRRKTAKDFNWYRHLDTISK